MAKYIGWVNVVRTRLFVGTLVVLAAASSSAHAACTSPAGESGDLIYATNYGVMTFCNGNQWVSMAGGVSVTVGGTTGATTLDELTDATITTPATGEYLTYSGTQWVNTASPLGTITDTKWCVGNSSGQVVCNTDAPITVEADPQVGTLTNTKWCTTDGTAINCATDAPVTTEVDPQLDTLTANLFCQVNAGGTALVCANSAATQRTALELGTMATQDADAVAITGGTATLTGLTAANVTATTALSAAALCDENGANCVDVSGGFSSADNMGDHTATRDVLMGAYNISGTGYVSATAFYSGDGAAYFYNNFIIPSLVFDTDDYLRYTRATNMFDVMIGGTSYARVTSGGISTTTLTADVVSASTVNSRYASFTTVYAGSASATTANVGSLTASGIVTASFFEGNGSRLTGITAAATAASSTGAIQFNVANAMAGDGANLFWDDANDRLGVGNSNPGYALEVAGDLASRWAVSMSRLFGTQYSTTYELGMRLLEATRETRIISKAADSTGLISFYTGVTPSERMRVNSSGNVGIGTTSPYSKLGLVGDGGLYSSGATSGGSPVGASLYLGDSNFNNSSFYNSAPGISAVFDATANVAASLAFYAYAGVANSRTEYMRLAYGGNLGIGTTAPSDKLHVKDATSIVGNPSIIVEGATGGYGAGIETGAALTGGSYLPMGKFVWDGESSWNTTASTQDAYARLFVAQDGTLTERMRITSAGNVGIGTTAPPYKLTASNSGAEGLEIGPGYAAGGTLFQAYNRTDSTYDYLTYSALDHRFQVSGVEKMRIDTSGNVGIGSSSPAGKLHVESTAPVPVIRDSDSASSITAYIALQNSAGTNKGYIGFAGSDNVDVYSASGSVRAYAGANVCTYTSGAAWSCSSDARMKTGITPLTNSLEKILQLQGVTYHWKDPAKAAAEHVGLIAQDVEKIYPQIVDDVSGTKVLDYSALIAPLIESIKELKAANDALAKRVDKQSQRNDNLRAELDTLRGFIGIATTDVETCADGSAVGTIRIDPATGGVQMCRK